MPTWKPWLKIRLTNLLEVFSLDGLQVACGTMGMPTCYGPPARSGWRESHPRRSWHRSGPRSLPSHRRHCQRAKHLVEFNIHAVTEGIDAIGEVTVRLQADNGSIPKRTSLRMKRLRRARLAVMVQILTSL
jgi:hypothetical protein